MLISGILISVGNAACCYQEDEIWWVVQFWTGGNDLISLIFPYPSSSIPSQDGWIILIYYLAVHVCDFSVLRSFQGEDEVMFMEYRKEMKILFDNIAQLVMIDFVSLCLTFNP